MSLKARLDALTRRLSGGGPCYAIPETVDVRALTPGARAQAIAGAEERAEGREFRGVRLVIIEKMEVC